MTDSNRTKTRAPRNRTLTCSPKELDSLATGVLTPLLLQDKKQVEGKIIHGDTFEVLPLLGHSFVDLLMVDPPYNLSKKYNGHLFK